MRVGVHLATGIRVVAPCSTDAERLLVDRERVDTGALELDPGCDTGETTADDGDARCAMSVQDVLLDVTI
jgi:hypothetical protein